MAAEAVSQQRMRGQRALSGPENLLEMLAGSIQSLDKAVEIAANIWTLPPKKRVSFSLFWGVGHVVAVIFWLAVEKFIRRSWHSFTSANIRAERTGFSHQREKSYHRDHNPSGLGSLVMDYKEKETPFGVDSELFGSWLLFVWDVSMFGFCSRNVWENRERSNLPMSLELYSMAYLKESFNNN